MKTTHEWVSYQQPYGPNSDGICTNPLVGVAALCGVKVYSYGDLSWPTTCITCKLLVALKAY